VALEADEVATTTQAPPTFPVGTKVYVRSQYIGAWSGGFVVAGVRERGYLLWRLSDRWVLPDVFPPDVVRLERRQHPLRGTRGSYLDRHQSR
jgi:hypothetical protein